MNYLPRFITFWTMLSLNGLVIWLIFKPIYLILLPDSIVKSVLLSFPLCRVLRIHFLPVGMVKKPLLDCASFPKKPQNDIGLMVIRMAGCQQEVHEPVPLILRRNRAMEDVIPNVSHSSSSSSSSSVVQVFTLPKFLDW